METVQQHEWRLNHIDFFGDEVYHCAHCPFKKHIDEEGEETYEHPQGEYILHEEPPCITRQPEQEAGKHGSKRTELDPEHPSA